MNKGEKFSLIGILIMLVILGVSIAKDNSTGCIFSLVLISLSTFVFVTSGDK